MAAMLAKLFQASVPPHKCALSFKLALNGLACMAAFSQDSFWYIAVICMSACLVSGSTYLTEDSCHLSE